MLKSTKNFQNKVTFRSVISYSTAILFLVLVPLIIYGATEYVALKNTNLLSIGKVAIIDHSFTSTTKLQARQLQNNVLSTSSTENINSLITIAIENIKVDYTAHSDIRLCDCTVNLSIPDIDPTVSSSSSITNSITFHPNGEICVKLSDISNTINVYTDIPSDNQNISSALLYYFTSSSNTVRPITGSLSCNVKVYLFPFVEPSTTLSYSFGLPSMNTNNTNALSSILSAGSSSSTGGNLNNRRLEDDNSNMNISSIFTSQWENNINIGLGIYSMINTILPSSTLEQNPLTNIDISLIGGTFMATTDTDPIAGIHIPTIDYHWNNSLDIMFTHDNNYLQISSGISPSVLTKTLMDSKNLPVALLSVLRGILPSNLQDLLSQISSFQSPSSTSVSASLNTYLFLIPNNRTNKPNILSYTASDSSINKRQYGMQQLDSQIRYAWQTIQQYFSHNHNDENKQSSTSSSSFLPSNFTTGSATIPSFTYLSNCNPFMNVARNMFQLLAIPNPSTSLPKNPCNNNTWIKPMLNMQITMMNNLGTHNKDNNIGKESSTSSAPVNNLSRRLQLINNIPTIQTTLTIVDPDISMSIYNMSIFLQASVSLSSSYFLNQAFAQLLQNQIGLWSISSRIETHISPVWRKAITDNMGNILSIQKPRTSSLWSSFDCGAAYIDIVPTSQSVFSLRGLAHLSELWTCFDKLSSEYMIGKYVGKPINLREIAIKPMNAIDQPKGAVRVVFPLIGTMSVPMGIASRRWLKSRLLATPLISGQDLEIPSLNGTYDVLPASAMVSHGAQVYSNVLMLTDLNCTNGSNDPLNCPGGVDNSKGKLARAWAISSHKVSVINQLKQYFDFGCASNYAGLPSAYCTAFESYWRNNGYLGIDGILLSGECSFNEFHPTTLCTSLSFSSDNYGITFLGMNGIQSYFQSTSIDPWNGPNGAVESKHTLGSALFRQRSGDNMADYALDFSGLDTTWYLRWEGQGNQTVGWSGVKLSAVNFYMWIRRYVSATVDGDIWWQNVGPVPRINGLICHIPSIEGFDIRYNRDCFYQAITPLARLGLTTLSRYVKGGKTLWDVFERFATKTLPAIFITPIEGIFRMMYQSLRTVISTDDGSQTITSNAENIVRIIFSLPFLIIRGFVYVPTTLFGVNELGSIIYWLLQNNLGIRGVYFDGLIKLYGTSLGSISFGTSIDSKDKFNNFEFSETLSIVNNGTTWTAIHRILCAAHGDSTTEPLPRPLNLQSEGLVGVYGNFPGNSQISQSIHAPYVLNMGTFIDSLDTMVSRAGLGMFPGWSTTTGFTKPFTDSLWFLLDTVAYNEIFSNRKCSKYPIIVLPTPTSTPSPTPSISNSTSAISTPLVSSSPIVNGNYSNTNSSSNSTSEVSPSAAVSSTPSPSKLPSFSNSPSSVPLYKRTEITVSIGFRINNLPSIIINNNYYIPDTIIIAIRQDIACSLNWNSSLVRINTIFSEASGTNMNFKDNAYVNTFYDSTYHCTNTNNTNNNKRQLQSSSGALSSYQIDTSAVVPQMNPDGSSTNFNENTAVQLQNNAVSFLATIATTTNIATMFPAIVSAATVYDPTFQPQNMTATSLTMPTITVPSTDTGSTVVIVNGNNGYTVGQVVGAAVGGVLITASIFIAMYMFIRYNAGSGTSLQSSAPMQLMDKNTIEHINPMTIRHNVNGPHSKFKMRELVPPAANNSTSNPASLYNTMSRTSNTSSRSNKIRENFAPQSTNYSNPNILILK